MLAFGHSGRGSGLHGAFSQAPRAGLAWPLATTVSNPTWMPARFFLVLRGLPRSPMCRGLQIVFRTVVLKSVVLQTVSQNSSLNLFQSCCSSNVCGDFRSVLRVLCVVWVEVSNDALLVHVLSSWKRQEAGPGWTAGCWGPGDC